MCGRPIHGVAIKTWLAHQHRDNGLRQGVPVSHTVSGLLQHCIGSATLKVGRGLVLGVVLLAATGGSACVRRPPSVPDGVPGRVDLDSLRGAGSDRRDRQAHSSRRTGRLRWRCITRRASASQLGRIGRRTYHDGRPGHRRTYLRANQPWTARGRRLRSLRNNPLPAVPTTGDIDAHVRCPGGRGNHANPRHGDHTQPPTDSGTVPCELRRWN